MLYNKIRAGKSYFINPLSRVELRERKKSTCTGCNEPRKTARTARCMNRSHRESLLLLLLLLPHSMRATTTGRHPRGGSERERREAQSIVADAKVKNTPSPQAIDSYIHFAFYSYCIYTCTQLRTFASVSILPTLTEPPYASAYRASECASKTYRFFIDHIKLLSSST